MSLLNQLNQELKNKAIKDEIEPFSYSNTNTTMTQETKQEQANFSSSDELKVKAKPIEKKQIEVIKYMTEIIRYPDGREFIRCYRVGKNKKDFFKKKEKKNLEEVNMTKCQEEVY